MQNRVLEAVVTSLVLGIVIFLVTYFANFLFEQNPTISIGTSTQISNNEYIVPIDIHSYNKELNDVQIVMDSKVTQNQIKADQPLKIKIIDNNVGAENSTTIEISHIPKDNYTNLFVVTDKKLSNEDINVDSNVNSLNVMFESDIENPVNEQIKSMIVNSILYALMMGLMTYYTNKNRDKKISMAREEVQKLENKLQSNVEAAAELKLEIKEVDNHIDKIKNDSIKKQILQQARLNDYRKELNFWRNTIRKTLYQLVNGDEKAEDLFKIVSKSLMTYQTNEKNEHDFETLKVLSMMISDIENDRE